jgi:NTE family protein
MNTIESAPLSRALYQFCNANTEKLRYIFLVLLMFIIQGLLRTASSNLQHTVSIEPGPGSIGLTLSGGGAKGFAHIGVLHVIDSIGLRVDYISGTSIGAIVGAMYATGYSAKEIEEIALSVDWRGVFGLRPALDYVHIHNRRSSGRNIVEFPLKSTGIQFRTGFIQGQQLWSLLEKLFFHVRGIDDFNNFMIPFACVATNIETGEEVVMNKGDIVTALRASMSMPAVFEPVTRNDMVLFDGGTVNNFPVDVAREMGADYVIGVYVSDGLRSADELRTPVEVIYQMGFIRDALKFRTNKEKADIFLEPDLEGFTAAGFSRISEIIDEGKRSARCYIALLDSLNRSGQNTRYQVIRQANRGKNIVIDSVLLSGLENVKPSFIRNIVNIHPLDTVDADRMQNLINTFYGTDYFGRVTYSFSPSSQEPEKMNLTFNFSEKPFARISGGIHYNTYSGVGITGGISATSFIFNNMDAGLSARLSQQPAVRSGIRIFTGNTRNTWINVNSYGEMIDFPLHRSFPAMGEYKNRYFRVESSVNRTTGHNSFFTAGTAIYTGMIEPEILTGLDFSGDEHGFEAFARWNKYSLDQHSFSRSGQNLSAELSYFFGRDHTLEVISENGDISDLPYLVTSGNSFLRINISWESFMSINRKLSYFARLQGGYQYPPAQGIFNMFNIGGDQHLLRNQFTFSGLNEFGILTTSVIAAAMGWNYNVASDFYLTPVLNVGLYDFRLNRLDELSTDMVVLGAGLGVGYLSLIGPIKISFSFSPQMESLVTSVNVGWSF